MYFSKKLKKKALFYLTFRIYYVKVIKRDVYEYNEKGVRIWQLKQLAKNLCLVTEEVMP